MCTSLRKGTWLAILESEIQPLFEDSVKMSDFQIFIDSDRKKYELLYDIHCYFNSILRSCKKAHCLWAKFAEVYNFIS